MAYIIPSACNFRVKPETKRNSPSTDVELALLARVVNNIGGEVINGNGEGCSFQHVSVDIVLNISLQHTVQSYRRYRVTDSTELRTVQSYGQYRVTAVKLRQTLTRLKEI